MTTKGQLLKLIRENCLHCVGDKQSEVELCTSTGEGNTQKCVFYDFRMGKDPRKNARKSAMARNSPMIKRKMEERGPTHADDDLERQTETLEQEPEPEPEDD
jgi:hypothetical protein